MLDEGGGHEREDKDEESEEGGGAAGGVERLGIVNREHAKKANTEQKGAPEVPALPEAEAQKNQEQRKKDGGEAMGALAKGTKNVAAIELRRRQEIERGGEESDPGSAPHGVKEETAGADAVAKKRRQKLQEERGTQDDFVVGGDGEAGDEFGVKDAEDERGDSDDESDEGSGSADVEERTVGANRRTDEDERAESANERWKRDEKGIAGANVVMAAGEEMAEFVSEKNDKKRYGKRESGGEG